MTSENEYFLCTQNTCRTQHCHFLCAKPNQTDQMKAKSNESKNKRLMLIILFVYNKKKNTSCIANILGISTKQILYSPSSLPSSKRNIIFALLLALLAEFTCLAISFIFLVMYTVISVRSLVGRKYGGTEYNGIDFMEISENICNAERVFNGSGPFNRD